mmetsp:Transcript_41286/g.122550  ORF Transcript_41286/g.122550 Transcript_41286/m.122550 type:complete len:335 (-) Transcript_41286:51-1055(-)
MQLVHLRLPEVGVRLLVQIMLRGDHALHEVLHLRDGGLQENVVRLLRQVDAVDEVDRAADLVEQGLLLVAPLLSGVLELLLDVRAALLEHPRALRHGGVAQLGLLGHARHLGLQALPGGLQVLGEVPLLVLSGLDLVAHRLQRLLAPPVQVVLHRLMLGGDRGLHGRHGGPHLLRLRLQAGEALLRGELRRGLLLHEDVEALHHVQVLVPDRGVLLQLGVQVVAHGLEHPGQLRVLLGAGAALLVELVGHRLELLRELVVGDVARRALRVHHLDDAINLRVGVAQGGLALRRLAGERDGGLVPADDLLLAIALQGLEALVLDPLQPLRHEGNLT